MPYKNKTDKEDYNKKFRQNRKKLNLCIYCSEFLNNKKYVSCKPCREKYRKNREYKRKEFPNKQLLVSAKSRAKQFNLDFNLELADIVVPKFCPVFRIPLSPNIGKGKKSMFSPTLDKLRPKLGYIKGNIEVISNRANTLKSDATLEELVALGKWAQKKLKGYV